MRRLRYLSAVTVAVLLAVVSNAAADPKRKDICVVDVPFGSTPLNNFVFQDVEPLEPGRSVPVHGIYFSSARRPAPFHGSAMMGTDGAVRLGIFVHSTAEQLNDFTISGVTDAAFAGTVKFDSDGDYQPNGTLDLRLADCATIVIP